MAKKTQKVPETKTRKPSRAERRGTMPAKDEPLARDPHPLEDQSVPDVRVKNTGHKKKTADTWNQ
jgi:hypothetical protein